MQLIQRLKKWWNGGEFSEGGQVVSASDPQLLDERRTPAKRGRPAVAIDAGEVVRLHDALGWSFRRIGRHLKHDAGTVLQRYEEYRAAHPVQSVPDPLIEPRASHATAQEPPAVAIRPETPALPDGLLSGLVRPGIAVRSPEPVPEPMPQPGEPTPQEPPEPYPTPEESVEPDEEYLFLVANDKDANAVAGYGLHTAAWTDSNGLARLRAARRIYLIASEPTRSEIQAALRLLAAKVKTCVGDFISLLTVAKRELVGRGDYANFAAFERFAGIAATPEPTPTMLPQTTEPQYGGTPPLEKYPNPAFQRVTRPW